MSFANEQEEFEFRLRLEQEQALAAAKPKPQLPGVMNTKTMPGLVNLATANPISALNTLGGDALQKTIQNPKTIPWQLAGVAADLAAPYVAVPAQIGKTVIPAIEEAKAGMRLAAMAGAAGGMGKSVQQSMEGKPQNLQEQAGEAKRQATLSAIGSAVSPLIRKGVDITSGIIGGVKNTAKAVYRGAVGKYKGLSGQLIDTAIDETSASTPTVINSLSPAVEEIGKRKKQAELLKEVAEKQKELVPEGLSPSEFSDLAMQQAQKLRKASTESLKIAKEGLSKDPTISKDMLLKPVEDVQKSLTTNDAVAGDVANQANTFLNRWKKYVENITKKTGSISERDVKDLVDKVDDDLKNNWEGIASNEAVEKMRVFRGKLRGLIKNERYNEAAKSAEEVIAKVDNLEKTLGLKLNRNFEVEKGLSTAGKTKSLLKGENDVALENVRSAGLGKEVDSAIESMRLNLQKEQAFKAAEKAANISYPSNDALYNKANSAATSGRYFDAEGQMRKSESYRKLEETLTPLLGEEHGKAVAEAAFRAATKEIFDKTKGNIRATFDFWGAIGHTLYGARLGRAKLENIQKLENRLMLGGKHLPGFRTTVKEMVNRGVSQGIRRGGSEK